MTKVVCFPPSSWRFSPICIHLAICKQEGLSSCPPPCPQASRKRDPTSPRSLGAGPGAARHQVYKPARAGDGGDGEEQDKDVKVGATLGGTEVPPLEQHPETSILGCSEVRKTSVMVALQPVCCSSTISGCFWGEFSTWGSPLFSHLPRWGGQPHSLQWRQSTQWGPQPASQSPFVPEIQAVTQSLAAPSCHLLDSTRGS